MAKLTSMQSVNCRFLRVWMAEHRITTRALARRIGCSESYLSHIRTGNRVPGRSIAVALERETGGAVLVSRWDTEPEPKADPEAA